MPGTSYTIDMRFNADTKQAKAAVEELRSALTGITTEQPIRFDDVELRKAAVAAQELQSHLDAAVNVKTGKLDISKFSQSLKASGKDLNYYYQQLSQIGDIGTQAFFKLSAAIASAEAPTLRINKHLATMWDNLKKTAGWQISSSIIHGAMGAVQQAYGYAQDLNESLNNIRIVTGQSADQMAAFARQANEAAHALSSTTLDYTNASLIYYQQGLSDEEVRERTDVTIKMANVTRDSAETVSSQMTAIWNNFEQGSHTLEYFSDVITALGATTASSSAEIAQGLEKFAPIAGTIGLSYENATAALATIIANTRQSAETVGTGLRTIFSRIESLNLGDTLEDGVNLSKYTKALQTVGVEVLDVNGKLKTADEILEAIAARWQTLDRTQQTALATTVGGVRQYTNLIALFDNWDDMQENLTTAYGATGALQKQADIYAESWEAARKHVQASLEGLYDSLLDDKTFIKITNFIAKVIDGIKSITEAMGGLQGILTYIGSIILNKYAKEIPTIIQNATSNIATLFPKLIPSQENATQQMYQQNTNTLMQAANESANEAGRVEAIGLARINEMHRELAKSASEMSKEEIAAYETKIKLAEASNQAAIAAAKQYDEQKKLADQAEKNLLLNNKQQNQGEEAIAQQVGLDEGRKISTVKGLITRQKNNIKKAEEKKFGLDEVINSELFSEEIKENAKKVIIKVDADISKAKEKIEELDLELKDLQDKAQTKALMEQDYKSGFKIPGIEGQEISLLSEEMGQDLWESVQPNGDAVHAQEILNQAYNNGIEAIRNLSVETGKYMEIAMGLRSQSDIWEKDAADKEKAGESTEELRRKVLEYLEVIKTQGVKSPILDNLIEQAKNGSISTTDLIAKLKEATHLTSNKGSNALFESIRKQAIDTDKVIDAVIKKLKELGFQIDDKQIEALKIAGQEQGAKSVPLNFGGSSSPEVPDIDKPIHDNEKFSESFGKVGSAAMSASYAISAVTNTIKVLGDSSASTSQKLMALLTTVGTLARSFNQISEGAKSLPNMAEKLGTFIIGDKEKGQSNLAARIKDAISNIGKVKGAATEATASVAEGAVAAGHSVAAAAEVSGAAAGASALAVGAIVLGVLAAIGVTAYLLIRKHQKEAEQLKKLQEEQMKNAQEAKQEADQNQKLISSYMAAKKAYDETKASGEDLTESQKAMEQAALDVTKAYEIQGAAIAILTGDYDGLTEAIIKAREAELARTRSSLEIGQRAAEGQLKTAAKSGLGYQVGNDGYTAYFGNGGGGSDEILISEYAASGKFETLKRATLGNSIKISTSLTGEGIAKAYEEVESVIAWAKENLGEEEFKQSEIITNMQNWLEKMSEAYQSYKLYEDQIAELGIEQKDLSGIDVNGKVFSSRNIQNQNDYNNYRKALIDSLNESNFKPDSEEYKKIASLVDAYLSNQKGLLDYSLAQKAAEDWIEQAGQDSYDKLVEKYSNEDAAIYLQIDPKSDPDTWDQQIELIKARAESQEIKLRLSFINSAQDLIDSGKAGIEEWKKLIEETGQDLPDNMSLGSWLLLSPSEQQEILDNYRETQEKLELENKKVQLEREQDEKRRLERQQNILSGQIISTESVRDSYSRFLSSETNTAIENFIDNNKDSYGNSLKDVLKKYSNEQIAKIAGYVKEYSKDQDWQKFDENMDKSGILRSQADEIARVLYNLQGSGGFELQDLQEYFLAQSHLEELNQKLQDLQNQKAEGKGNIEAIEAEIEALQKEKDLLEQDTALFKEIEREGFEVSAISEYAAYLRQIGTIIQEVGESEDNFRKRSMRLALEIQKVERGFKSLNSSGKEWFNTLKTADKDSNDYRVALQGMQKALSDLTGAEKNLFSDEWIKNHEDLIDQVIEGSEEAAKQLQVEVGKTTFDNLGLKLDQTQLQSIFSQLETMMPDLTVGTRIDDTEFFNTLNSMLIGAGATADQITAALSSIGMEANVVDMEVPSTSVHQTKTGGYVVDIAGHTYAIQGEVDTEAGGMITVPVIKGATYKGTGVTKPSGGGGGGGGKKREASNKNYLNDNRYHVIEQRQSRNNEQLEDVRNRQSHAVGRERLHQMREEIALQEEQIDLAKQHFDASKEYLEMDKQAVVDLGYELHFDSNGVITNYYDILQDLQNQFNDYEQQWIDEKIDDDQWSEIQKDIEERIEKIHKYEETLATYYEDENNYLEAMREQMAKKVEELDLAVQLKVEVDTNQIEYLDFLLGQIEDDAFAAAQKIAMIGGQTQATLNQMEAYREGIRNIFDLVDPSGDLAARFLAGENIDVTQYDFTSEQIDKLAEYRDNLMELTNDMREQYNTIFEELTSIFDAYNEKMDDAIDKFDHFNKILTNYKNIIDIVGRQTLGIDASVIKALSDAQHQFDIDRVSATRIRFEELAKSTAAAEEALARAREQQDEQAIKHWEETLKKFTEDTTTAREEFTQAFEDAIQSAVEAFEVAVDQASTEFERMLSPDGLEYLQTAFDRQAEARERYLEDYEKLYELSKLTRDIENSINDTNNIAGKEKLLALQEEINEAYAEGADVSQRDVDYMRQRYELRLAEIALEEAQNAKNQVRLTRDNEGNYSYTYTADQSNIEKAQQDYEDKLYEIQQASNDYVKEMESNLMQLQQDFRDAATNIAKDTSLSAPEKRRELDALLQDYRDRLFYYQDEMQKNFDYMTDIRDDDYRNIYDSMYNRFDIAANFLTDFEDTILSGLIGEDNLSSYTDQSLSAADEFKLAIEANIDELTAKNQEAFDAAGASWENFGLEVSGILADLKEQSSTVVSDVTQIAEEMSEKMPEAFEEVNSWLDAFSEMVQTSTTNVNSMVESVNNLIKSLNELDNMDINYSINGATAGFGRTVNAGGTSGAGVGVPEASGSGGGPSGPGSGGSGTFEHNYYQVITKDGIIYNAADFKNWPDVRDRMVELFSNNTDKVITNYKLLKTETNSIESWARSIKPVGAINARTDDKNKTVSISKYDTGGYTGAWGDEGKIAMLHEKELVLNKEDTKNILDTVQLVRNWSNLIDMNASSTSNGLGRLIATSLTTSGLNLQQEVHIQADFPNVTDHNEIKEAFNMLINDASQYANRKV